MSFPINYSFVSTKQVLFDGPNGEKVEHSLLVLDTESNDAYWRKIKSFKDTYALAFPNGDTVPPFKPLNWKMNSAFMDLAVFDLISEELSDEREPTIFGLPIYKEIDDLPPSCVLELEDNIKILNDFWKCST